MRAVFTALAIVFLRYGEAFAVEEPQADLQLKVIYPSSSPVMLDGTHRISSWPQEDVATCVLRKQAAADSAAALFGKLGPIYRGGVVEVACVGGDPARADIPTSGPPDGSDPDPGPGPISE